MGTDECEIWTGDVVIGFDENNIGRHVCVFRELVEASGDVGFEWRVGELDDVVLVGDELHFYLVGVYSYKIPRFARLELSYYYAKSNDTD
jgi:hypothetical protein